MIELSLHKLPDNFNLPCLKSYNFRMLLSEVCFILQLKFNQHLKITKAEKVTKNYLVNSKLNHISKNYYLQRCAVPFISDIQIEFFFLT